MSNSGAVTLGDMAGKLIDRHGADAQLTNLRTFLAGDCPRVGAASISERCGLQW